MPETQPTETMHLSETALNLLRRRLTGERVEVTDETLSDYRELVGAGLMMPLATFTRGPEGAFRLTDAACDIRERMQVNAFSTPPPSA